MIESVKVTSAEVFAVDVGNTRCHYGWVGPDGLESVASCPTESLRDSPESPFAEFLRGRNTAGAIGAFCSVVPACNSAVEVFIQEAGLDPFHLTAENCGGLSIRYPRPKEIGEDRLANAVAAIELFGAPVIVIDMGTAVTFDIVTRAGGYEGGIIAPGLAIMTRYLHEQTALLPALSPEELVNIEGGIGRSTVDAMRLGCSVGFSGMLAALLDRVVAELAKMGENDPVVISTGGSIVNLCREWEGKTRFVPDLTLLGLALAARNQR